MKPQIGAAVAVFWMVEAWRVGGWRKALYTFAPVTIAFALSFIVYGNWIASGVLLHSSAQIFPYGVPLGLLTLAVAIYFRRIELSMCAGVLLSPYVNAFSWSFLWVGLVVAIGNYRAYNWNSAIWRKVRGNA
jgi:hypothetical protein